MNGLLPQPFLRALRLSIHGTYFFMTAGWWSAVNTKAALTSSPNSRRRSRRCRTQHPETGVAIRECSGETHRLDKQPELGPLLPGPSNRT